MGQWLLVFDNADDINMWVATPRLGPETEQESRQGSGRLIDYKQGCTRDRKAAVKLAIENAKHLLPSMGPCISFWATEAPAAMNASFRSSWFLK